MDIKLPKVKIGYTVQSVKLHIPPKLVHTDTYHRICVDALIGRKFVIDPKWVPQDNLPIAPSVDRAKGVVYTVKRISKRRVSVWFDYEDEEKVVPIQHIEIVPFSHEIPYADGDAFDTMLEAWAEVWQFYIEATARVEHLERYHKRQEDELCESIDEIQLLRKLVVLNDQASKSIIKDRDQRIAQLEQTLPGKAKLLGMKCLVVLTTDIADHSLIALSLLVLVVCAFMGFLSCLAYA